MKIAVFGGSFNPPHLGHMFVCQYILSTNLADKVWLMPVFKHPFYKKLLDYDDRVAMCCNIANEFLHVEVCREERFTLVDGVNKTLFSMKALKELYPEYDFSFVIGSDILQESAEWYEFDKLKEFADLIVVGRSGYKHSEDTIYLPDISSTQIWARIKEEKSISHLVHHKVLDFMNKLGELEK